MSARKIAEWHAAGLIDGATRDRLLAHEAAHARPLLIWAVWGIGALAIGLGLISLIAANWEAIPPALRLGIHLALIAVLIGLLLAREARLAARSPWAAEALVFVIAALGLTFFGHLGQAYQSAAPLWQPLGLWLALFAPLMLLMGRGWPVALALVGGLAWCAWDYAGAALSPDEPGAALRLWVGLATAAPLLLAPLAAALRARSARSAFWRRLEQLALAYGVAGASLACAVASAGELGREEMRGTAIQLLASGVIALIAGGAVAALRPGTSGRMAGAIIAGAGLAAALAAFANGHTVPAAALFMALWAGIAAAALAAAWRGVFQLAVGVIAARLIILSFELAADLLTSGLGLILAGLMVLGIAWLAVRVSQRLAPAAGDEP